MTNATSDTTTTAAEASLRFKVSGRISRPVEEVFEAVVDPGKLSQYFTTGGARGRLETGSTVQWDFADFPGAFPVEVVTVEENRLIVLRWAGADDGRGTDYQTTVTMSFEPLDDGRTLVTVAEEGWRPTEQGQQAAFDNCDGWAGVLLCLKAWLEHGLTLRDGFYA